MPKAMKLPTGMKLPGTDLDLAFVGECLDIWNRLSPAKRQIALEKMELMIREQEEDHG